MSGSNQQSDAAVDAIVARAAHMAILDTSRHNAIYETLLTDLQQELDADPSSVVGGGS